MNDTGTIVGLVASVLAIFFLFCCYACDLHELVPRRRSRSVTGSDAASRSTLPRLQNVRPSSDVIAALPVFVVCGPLADDDKLECAVCLAEFGDGEKGRILPICGHSFHTECIDMWFRSQSTCPLCRLPVGHVEGLVSIAL